MFKHSSPVFFLPGLLLILNLMISPTSAQEKITVLPAAPESSFSVIVIPDTQKYILQPAGSKEMPPRLTNPIFKAHTDWIAHNIDRQKIVFVSHVGDIVDKNVPEQWEVARKCMDTIHGKIPYGISVGNHDMTKEGDSRLFQKYFPASRFQEFEWYGGTFSAAGRTTPISQNNANSYQFFTAGGMKFLILHLECNAPDDVLEWANEILLRHADYRTIVTTHMDLGPLQRPQQPQEFFNAPKGRMRWKKMHGKLGNTSQQMWEKCFCKHQQVFMICCGDQSRTQAMKLQSQGEQENRIQELLCDYGECWLRMYRFHPEKNLVEAWTFNPRDETLCLKTSIVKDRQQHQFSFAYPMTNAGE